MFRVCSCIAGAVISVAAGCGGGAAPLPPGEFTEIDFYQASGITQQEMATFLEGVAARDGTDGHPMYLSLQNDLGDYLVDSPVLVRWETGEHRLMVGKSGVVQFWITKDKLPGLKLFAPAAYVQFTQRSVALGSAYQPEETLATSDWDCTVNFDGFTLERLTRQLRRMRAVGEVLDYETLRDQLHRRQCSLQLPEPPEIEMAPSEIFRLRKDTVVTIANLFENGSYTHGTGVIPDPSGVFATAHHVIDKPPTVVARGVMTLDGRMYAVKEVLAANKSNDVVLLKIDAQDLPAAPLSHGDPEGSPVTVIAHPGDHFYNLTQGYISRYWAATSFGRLGVRMSVTAEFADGASGGPIFNSCGAVTGLVSSTDAMGYQMVRRSGPPARSIRMLLQPPSPVSPDRDKAAE